MLKISRLFPLILALLLILGAPCAIAEHTRDEVRAAYAALNMERESSPYADMPSVQGEYSAGALTNDALSDAVDYLNFLRYLAYIDAPIVLDASLNGICQHGAVLLAASDVIDHSAPNPGDMPASFYEVANFATKSSNLASINWMKGDILITAIEYFARDDGAANLSVLGHRRWVLNPAMGKTGFGLASSASGMSYVLMFAHDLSADAGEWRSVNWPSAGAFPAELMRGQVAWSITLNPDVYDLHSSSPVISLRETLSGTEFSFEEPVGEVPGGYYAINEGSYGAGPCLIFRPDIESAGIEEYFQNQRWEVSVGGLVARDGGETRIDYVVEMIALERIDPATVEISRLDAQLSVGESLQLSATVIPAWADDVSVTWRSSNEDVATVDTSGRVMALSTGACEIYAESANGREDSCKVTVK